MSSKTNQTHKFELRDHSPYFIHVILKTGNTFEPNNIQVKIQIQHLEQDIVSRNEIQNKLKLWEHETNICHFFNLGYISSHKAQPCFISQSRLKENTWKLRRKQGEWRINNSSSNRTSPESTIKQYHIATQDKFRNLQTQTIFYPNTRLWNFS